MIKGPEARPNLTRSTNGTELQRWYWLKDELTEFARLLGIRTTGSKEALSERIASHLDGRVSEETPVGHSPCHSQLQPPLCADTVIPQGQRCSQSVRVWFSEQVGAPFRFDAEMREFFASTDGTQTLRDALENWQRTRNQGAMWIDAQFEYNRFTRAWHRENPHGTRSELLAAWRQYRGTPVDERGRI